MSRPEAGEVSQFLSDVRNLSRDQVDLIGDVWRKGAADLPTETTSDVNVEIAAIVREERFGPTLAWLVDEIRAAAGTAQDDLVIEGLRVGVRARNVASKYVRNSNASDAVAGMVIVMVLRALLPDSLVAIVAVPFDAVRPGWPLHLDSPQMRSELEPEIESLPFLGTTWYMRRGSYWVRRALLSLLSLGLIAFDVAITEFVLLPGLNRTEAEVFLLVVIVFGIASGVWLWRRSPPAQQRQQSGRKTWTRAGTAVAIGALVLTVLVLGPGTFFWLAPFTVGSFAVLFIRSVAPVLYLEAQARERLEPWFKDQGRIAPWIGP